jgi:hypothetical protein
MFDTKEQEIIKYGVANGKTKEQVQEAITNYRLGMQPEKQIQPTEQPNYFQRVGSKLMETGKEVTEAVMKPSKMVEQEEQPESVDFLRVGLRTAGAVARTPFDIIGELPGVKQSLEGIGSLIGKIPGVEEVVKNGVELATKYPEIAKDIQNIVDIATLGGAGMAEKPLKEAVVKTAGKVAETTAKATEAISQSVKPIAETTGKVISGAKEVGKATLENAKQIPGRVATNVAESKATTEAISKLPSQVAKNAVQNGIDINDIKYIYKIPAEQKQPLKELFKATKDFVSGTSKTNPIEIVGKPIVERIKTLKTSLGTVGQKLGKASESLGTVVKEELTPKILESLQKVPGLNGLTLTKKGLLDFKNTVLASGETLSDRNAIQRIFTDAVKSGTGKQKHLLRQELFEVLGGKKGAMIAMTDTQDKAYQAIRQGLSDILDTKNSVYKTLNKEYSTIIQPLNSISKFMKLNKLAGATEDILNMDAGLLARRLTSNAGSNPEIRNLLRLLDKATKKTGKTAINVENLQDFYNILDKYYDIAGKTTLQGQVQMGVEKASGIKDVISQAVGQVAGKTEAVRRKAIEDALNEILR